MEETHIFCPLDGKRYFSNVCEACGRPRHVKKPQWKKVLYEKQAFKDSYVDENFLNSLTTQENSKKYNFWSLVDSTVEIAFALNSLVLFLVLHEIAQMEYISDSTLLILCFFLLVFGYVLHVALTPAEERSLKPIRMGLLLLGILYTLCPVLASINKNYANDTIYLMTFVFSILHLVFYDYSFVKNALKKDKKRSPDVKSMNFALIAALLLSSRLTTLNYVYFMLSFGILVFGFLPYFRSTIYSYSASFHSNLGVVLCILNTWAVSYFSVLLSGLVLSTYFFIRYIGPLWLISVYHYKNEIKGPWDLPEIKQNYK